VKLVTRNSLAASVYQQIKGDIFDFRLLLRSHIESSKSVVRLITLHRLHSARTLPAVRRARGA
jgi:hypothetical protein